MGFANTARDARIALENQLMEHMNVRFELLREEDLAPYIDRDFPVRIHKNSWFAGSLAHASIVDGACKIRLMPFFRLGHAKQVDWDNLGVSLFYPNDRPIVHSVETSEQRFVLERPQKVILDGDAASGILVIQSEHSDWKAAISSRPLDIEAFKRMLERATHGAAV